jgi:ubiquinone/menaquinone biosynthesis C-methylase UbiE
MSRYSTFKRYILPLVRDHITLDLGCGTGEFLEWFKKGSIGIDVSVSMLEKCREKNLCVLLADLNHPLPFKDKSFDRVFCAHTLEHVESPIQLLRECNRVLRPEGKLVLGLPRESSLLEFFDKYFDDHPYHLYSFSLRNISHLLKRAGFVVERFFFDVPKVFEFLTPIIQYLPSWIAIHFCFSYWVVATKVYDDLQLIEYTMGNKELERRWFK